MPIIEPCIRPPSEAESLLLQVTTGCSCNTCTFCGAYLNKPFGVKDLDEIYSDIDEYALYCSDVRKVFLMDGDALVLNNNKILPVLNRIHEKLPKVSKISSYVNGFSITNRSKEELQTLFDHKVKLIYMGLESGSQEILDTCKKKSTVNEMIEAVNKANEAGIKTSLMVLLGLGGREKSQLHIEESAKAINAMQPKYLSFLSVMLIPGTDLYKQSLDGTFKPLDARGFLIETYEILTRLELNQTLFFANHASNYLPLTGRLPSGKNQLLHTLKSAIKGDLALKPEFFRGL